MFYRRLLFCLVSILLLGKVSAQSEISVPIETIVTVPEGFQVEVYARGQETGTPTVLAFGPDNRLYVLGQEGSLNTFEDRDVDGYAETQTTI